MEHYRSYQLIDSCYTDLEILDPETLNDYHPLALYTVAGMLVTKGMPAALNIKWYVF